MNNTMLQRLFWKEYRTQRGFWLGVAGMGLLLQLIVLMGIEKLDDRIQMLFGISLALPGCLWRNSASALSAPFSWLPFWFYSHGAWQAGAPLIFGAG